MNSLKTGPKNNRNKSGAGAAHKDQLRKNAIARQTEYNKLTTEQKVAKLDAGGFRALKQRAKIETQRLANVAGSKPTPVAGQRAMQSVKAKTKQDARKEMRDNRHPSRTNGRK